MILVLLIFVLVEQFAASYTPGYLIRELACNVGFEQVYTWDDGGPSVWLELRKPGTLDSLRGGQMMAAIKDYNSIEEDIFAERSSQHQGVFGGHELN